MLVLTNEPGRVPQAMCGGLRHPGAQARLVRRDSLRARDPERERPPELCRPAADKAVLRRAAVST